MLNIEVNQTPEHYKAIEKITTRTEQIKRRTKEKVEIVRCRDCKYFNHKELECQCDGIVQDLADSASFRLNFYLDDYCSYGVRKDDTNVQGS